MNDDKSQASSEALTGVVIAEVLAALANEFDPPAVLATIADHARSGLSAHSAAIMLLDHRTDQPDNGVQIVAEAFADSGPAELDFQTTGPGLASAINGVVTMIDDIALAGDTRWPDYRRSALAAGLRAVRAYPIVSMGVSVGSLVVHTDQPWGNDRPNRLGQIMANLTALALASAVVDKRQLDTTRTIDTLLEGRVVIATATGILAETLALDVRAARLALTRLARAHSRSVSAYARVIVDGHNADPANAGATPAWARPPDATPLGRIKD